MRKIHILLLILILSVIAGCGPKTVPEETSSGPCLIEDVKVEVNDKSMEVTWKPECNKLISGYNVYISETPLNEKYPDTDINVAPHNTSTFPGDTEPNDGIEHYQADHLENGKEYYVSVRIVNPDRTLSKPSKEVTAVCGPQGEIELAVRYKADNDGYSFAKNSYVRADDIANDLYFFTKDGQDYLSSPHKLDGFLRTNKFAKFTEFKGNPPGAGAKAPKEDRVTIKKSDLVLMKTVENHTVLINVLGFEGRGEKRTVKLYFSYRPKADQ